MRCRLCKYNYIITNKDVSFCHVIWKGPAISYVINSLSLSVCVWLFFFLSLSLSLPLSPSLSLSLSFSLYLSIYPLYICIDEQGHMYIYVFTDQNERAGEANWMNINETDEKTFLNDVWDWRWHAWLSYSSYHRPNPTTTMILYLWP